MRRIRHQILLLEEGPRASHIIRAIDKQGAKAFITSMLKKAHKMRVQYETDRSLVQPHIGDETVSHGAFRLCWNRKYVYASLTRRITVKSAPVGRGDTHRGSIHEHPHHC